ncbi:MAG: ATP-dependent helicase [Lachnospiraceae bacterium]|nr:ATP-dependent helicase [Lachnospiraceae bacterium]
MMTEQLIEQITEKLTNGLTDNQKAAVKTLDQDLELVACAGAGKTKTITHRIINLIAHGVKPENIVAITFTRKAAAEMLGRIYKIGQEVLGNTTGFAGMYIGTIDAFCLKLLQDHKEEYAKYSVLDEVQTRVFLERYERKDQSGFRGSVVDRAFNLNNSYDFESRNHYPDEKFSKKLDIYAGLMAMLNSNWYDRTYRDRWSDDLKEMLRKYNKCLSDHKYFDFSSLIRLMIEELDPDSDQNGGRMSDFGRAVFEKVKYLTIDEYQDTNPCQEHLTWLFKHYGNANICVVGDADQTIYQFRGSDESNILTFHEKYNARLIHLNEDFRSTEAVIDIASKVIGVAHRNDAAYVGMERGQIEGAALAYEPGDTVWSEFETFDQEADFIVNRIKALKEIGIPYMEMAILFRSRRETDYGKTLVDFQKTMAERLQEAGIPYIVEGLNNLFLTKEYDAACEIFRYLFEKMARGIPVSKDVWRYGYLSGDDAAEKETQARRSLKEAWLAIDHPIEESGLDRAIDQLAAIDWENRKYGHECNMQQIYQDFIGHLSILSDEDDDAQRILFNMGKFSKVIADYELLYFKERPVFKINHFNRHLTKVAQGLYPEGMEDNVYQRGDAVRIMTIHQSKGLEFTAVFVPVLVRDIYDGVGMQYRNKIYNELDVIGNDHADWIQNYDKRRGEHEGERKLVYVAVTRAKKYLYLTYGKNYGGKTETCSDFLEDAFASDYLKEYADGVPYGTEHLPKVKEEVIPITLNFSVLSNYFDCPYRFKLSNMYGFVQPYIQEQGYGKMLHEIMMHIHRAWIDGKALSDNEIRSIAQNALYLPFASDPQLENSLQGAISCARAYVRQNGKDADKIEAAEMDIFIEMGEGVSVNGRIDLVRKIESGGEEKTAIVDLKSAGKDAEQCLNAEQLKIYAIGYQEMTGQDPDYLMIYNLDHPDGSKNAGEEVVSDQLIETRQHVLEAARSIRDCNLPRHRSDKCKNCYVRNLCGK